MATRINRKRGRNGESGAELIEFALVFMILMLLVLGIVDFALLFQRNEVLANAVREGARVAVLPGYVQADIENRVLAYVAQGGLPTTGSNPTVTVTPTTVPEFGGTRAATTVSVAYDHTYVFLDAVTAFFGGPLGPVTLQHQSTMRHELAAP